ncbi:nuclear transport factor 2 family protein [Arthrobacter russicus]|jgi:hypothetical protein|uniref:Nuclear transport factor 2 family protein n=1 Tax=Arthrobacter russicus TaxID=172040 RepID=A0ABU1JC48_9MICC|nr:nuclear transport factor 2 family protein [Arthrobacter russicus]MBQ1444912.1 nuclear transport factor 2 family protein [Renibacterium sp.]MDN5667272.1 nuclear transport factor 2 family protein [Renibacterium salmoninarum]MDR6270003.1 hypothetical protein [Arthrobacter russicus]
MTVELPAAIQRAFDATNSADDDGFVAAFASDGFINDWGRQLNGSDGVASWNSTDNIGKQATWEALSIEDQGHGKYLVSIRTGGNGYNGVSPFVFTVADDKIQSMVISAG